MTTQKLHTTVPDRSYPRHPAEVTADRLADHLEKWFDESDAEVQHAVSVIRDWLENIAEHDLA
jgi:hypothetical protein